MHYVQDRKQESCAGAYTLRYLVTYRDGKPKTLENISQQLFLEEIAPANTEVLKLDRLVGYYVRVEPWGDLSKWNLVFYIHNNCPLWYRLLPEDIRLLFRESTEEVPPVPLTVGTPPQIASSKDLNHD